MARHLVPRPRLVAPLESGSPLTLLRASLGFGKSALLAQWLHTSPPGAVAWMAVTTDSTEPSGFWETLLDALNDAGVAGRAGPGSARAQARRAVGSTERPVILVIDAFDRVSVPGVDDDLLDLLRTCPNLRLVVSLRGRRYFRPYQHLDLDASVITATDLLLTVEETASLLDRLDAGVTVEELRLIHAETGGWVELTLALAIALGQPGQRRAPVDERFTTRVALDYVHERILPAIGSEDHAAITLSTSLLEEVSADLADALVQKGSAAPVLEGFETVGGLPATADHGTPAYRWSPAVRRALAHELHHAAPERARELHRRIARWHADHHRPEETLDHAVAARDWQLVVRTVEQHWRSLILDHPTQLFGALEAIPPGSVAGHLRATAMHSLRFPTPDRYLLAAVPALPAEPAQLANLGKEAESADILDTGLALLVALRRRGLFPRALAYCRQLETLAANHAATSGEPPESVACTLLQFALVHLLADDIGVGSHLLQSSFELGTTSGFGYLRREVASKLALVLALDGEAQQAALWLDRYHRAPRERTWLHRTIAQTAAAADALLALDRLDLDGASNALDAGAGEIETDEFLAFVTYVRALVALQHRDPILGIHEIDHFRATRPAWHTAGSTARPLLAGAEVDLLIAANRGNQARAVLAASDRDDHPLLRSPAARLALLGGDAKAALDLATNTSRSRRVGRRSRVELLVVRAVAHHRLGDDAAAAEALGLALKAAETTRCLRAFTTVPWAELVTIAQRLPPSSRALLDAPELRERSDVLPAHVELIDLTDREQAVLEQLARGLPLRGIARELYVSVNTVKTQCRSLYQKLDASSRGQALAKARESGLLP